MARKLNPSDVWEDEKGEVIFSFVNGFVWASWPGAAAIVRIGGYEATTTAMRDFLAQCELGERLGNDDPEPSLARRSGA